MSLKTFVKIGKIENLSDARYCAGMMVDILGFNLEEGTEAYLSPERFKEITDWVAGVSFCGEFAHAQAAEVKLAATQYPVEYIETQNIDQLEELTDLDQELIFKLIIADTEDLTKLESSINYASEFAKFISIHLTSDSLKSEVEAILSKMDPRPKLLRGYTLTHENAFEVASDTMYFGIELEGSPEDRPGFKDYGNVMDILEVLEED
ncbi:MAG: phosphoribosylanthranilate isomerase [Marinoscillum sp.]|uniref:phosphoribosylanthranilate isomerase n=1 Tax=Marinoscillum sp. TaxID=2024838 RepID=UPI00330291D1